MTQHLLWLIFGYGLRRTGRGLVVAREGRREDQTAPSTRRVHSHLMPARIRKLVVQLDEITGCRHVDAVVRIPEGQRRRTCTRWRGARQWQVLPGHGITCDVVREAGPREAELHARACLRIAAYRRPRIRAGHGR